MGGAKGEGQDNKLEKKSEKRIQAAAARRAAADREERRRRTTRLITAGSIVLVVLVGVIFSFVSNKTNSSATTPPSAVAANHSGLTFNPSAKPVIDVWEDFQCPACGLFESVNGQTLHDVVASGKAKVIFHMLSFIGPESTILANAGGCADQVGKFLPLHSYLYAHQVTENSGFWGTSQVIAAGAAAGITEKTFADCVSAGTYSKWVQNIEASGSTQNINQTPTIFINGKELDRSTGIYGDKALFNAALAAAGVK